MAQKKGGGSTRNGRDSKPKMLGVKAFGGELISAKTTLCLPWLTATCRFLPKVSSASTWST